MTGFIILSLYSLMCGYILWILAEKRGANTVFWAAMGAVFGPLAIPFVFLTKKKIEHILNSPHPEMDDFYFLSEDKNFRCLGEK